jgi:selenocysteine lyase/cysteine desulfurase
VIGSRPLGAQREAFAVPPEIAYFDTATLSPQLRRVRAAGEAALERRARPWKFTADDWFADVERLRTLFAQLVRADADGIALVPATSYGFAVAARNLALQPGERVLVLAEGYPSGIYTWQAATRATSADIVTVHRQPGQSWADAVLAVLDERVRIVSVPNVHWTDGALVDLDAISARVHELGAHLVIDGSQSIGAMPFDVARIRPDFVTTVGYKWLLGPVGVSYLYVAEQHRDGAPIEQNWIARAGSEDFSRLVDYRDDYQPGARRFDVGQRSHLELLPMAVAALEQLGEWGVERIADALAGVTDSVANVAAALGLDPMPSDQRGPHMLGVRLPDTVRTRIAAGLAAADCYAAVRGEMLRLAPHLHVTDADVDRLADALARILSSGSERTRG